MTYKVLYTYYISISLILLFFSSASIQAQDTTATNLTPFQKIIRANRPLSYLTLGQGIGNLEPLLFEAQVSPSFFVSFKREAWALQLTPHIILRMKNKRSFPVENPSYRVPLYFHHRLDFWEKTFFKELFFQKAYATYGLLHHSNGQEGPFFKDDGSINLDNGSFSTNAFSVTITSYENHNSSIPFGFNVLQLYYEQHLPWISFENAKYPNALEERYGLSRIFLQYSNLNLARKGVECPSRFLANSRIISRVGWIFGQRQEARPVDLGERLIASLRYIYYPQWLDEIALFAEYYQGEDFYNIRFERNLYVFRIGFISDPLRLRQPSNIFTRDEG